VFLSKTVAISPEMSTYHTR